MKTRELTAPDVVFTISYEADDLAVRGNAMASGDPETDREAEDMILRRLESGDDSAWCTVVVTASWNGSYCSDYLGACTLTDECTKERVAEEHGMHAEALRRLNELISGMVKKYEPLINTDPPPDTRSMRDLANEAIRVQDACNLSGVVLSFGKTILRLRALLREKGTDSTEDVNTHPISKAWASKIHDLTQLPEKRGVLRSSMVFWDDLHELAERG